MVTITSHERGTTVRSRIIYQYNGINTDPTSPNISVIKPDGTNLISVQSGTKESTGQYVYYFETASTDTLGLYKVVWSATYTINSIDYVILDRKLISIVDTSQ